MVSEAAVHEAIKKLAQQASKTARQNNIAASMRFGGRYTPDGLAAAEKEAELNAMDRINLKGLMASQFGPYNQGAMV